MSPEELQRQIQEVSGNSLTEPITDEDVREYRKGVLERYAEVVKRTSLPLNDEGTVDWQAVIEEEREKLNKQSDS